MVKTVQWRKNLVLEGNHPFNGTVTDGPNGKVCIYRYDIYQLAMQKLDYEFNPVGIPEMLPYDSSVDPRAVWTGDRLYLSTSYSGLWLNGKGRRVMELRSILFPLGRPYIQWHDQFWDVEGILDQDEKNWTLFVHEDNLYCVHTLSPHKILHLTSDTAVLRYETLHTLPKYWSPAYGSALRLSVPPLRISDDEYLAMFHSKNKVNEYYSGFYTFETAAPFRIRRMTSEPVFGPEDSTGTNFRSEIGSRGLFFLGMYWNGKELILSGGDNQHTVCVHGVDLERLLGRMIEV